MGPILARMTAQRSDSTPTARPSGLATLFVAAERPDLYVIAEAGVNHDGSVADAHALVDLAADTGADAIKFQTFDPAALVSATAQTAAYQAASTGVRTQRELLEQYVLPDEAWPELRDHAIERRRLLSTAFDLASLDLVCELGVHALKLGSGELTNQPLLTEVARRACRSSAPPAWAPRPRSATRSVGSRPLPGCC